MTAFSLVMLGKMVFLVCFFRCCGFMSESSSFSLFFINLKRIFFFFFKSSRLCFDCSYFTTGTLTRGDTDIFHLLHQMSTRCLSAKALSFWREERSH